MPLHDYYHATGPIFLPLWQVLLTRFLFAWSQRLTGSVALLQQTLSYSGLTKVRFITPRSNDTLKHYKCISVFDVLPPLSSTCQDDLRASSLDELNDAVRLMPYGSTPGSDGLPSEFYRTFWALLRPFALRVFSTILGYEHVPFNFALGRVVLVLETGVDLRDPSSWRSVTILNVDYKLFMSIFARRLRNVLSDIVHEALSCSVPGRGMDPALSGMRDLIPYTNRCGSSGCVLSLDQSKGFDRIQFSYTFIVSEK